MHDIQILTEQNRSETLKIWIPLMDKLDVSLNIQLLGKNEVIQLHHLLGYCGSRLLGTLKY